MPSASSCSMVIRMCCLLAVRSVADPLSHLRSGWDSAKRPLRQRTRSRPRDVRTGPGHDSDIARAPAQRGPLPDRDSSATTPPERSTALGADSGNHNMWTSARASPRDMHPCCSARQTKGREDCLTTWELAFRTHSTQRVPPVVTAPMPRRRQRSARPNARRSVPVRCAPPRRGRPDSLMPVFHEHALRALASLAETVLEPGITFALLDVGSPRWAPRRLRPTGLADRASTRGRRAPDSRRRPPRPRHPRALPRRPLRPRRRRSGAQALERRALGPGRSRAWRNVSGRRIRQLLRTSGVGVAWSGPP